MEIIQSLQNRIFEIRGQRVILDKDIAQLYEIETRVLNQSVKRNIDRFPEDFMFQLNKQELESIELQNNVKNATPNLRSQIVTSSFLIFKPIAFHNFETLFGILPPKRS